MPVSVSTGGLLTLPAGPSAAPHLASDPVKVSPSWYGGSGTTARILSGVAYGTADKRKFLRRHDESLDGGKRQLVGVFLRRADHFGFGGRHTDAFGDGLELLSGRFGVSGYLADAHFSAQQANDQH
jgi:hypothetical protein